MLTYSGACGKCDGSVATFADVPRETAPDKFVLRCHCGAAIVAEMTDYTGLAAGLADLLNLTPILTGILTARADQIATEGGGFKENVGDSKTLRDAAAILERRF